MALQIPRACVVADCQPAHQAINPPTTYRSWKKQKSASIRFCTVKHIRDVVRSPIDMLERIGWAGIDSNQDWIYDGVMVNFKDFEITICAEEG